MRKIRKLLGKIVGIIILLILVAVLAFAAFGEKAIKVAIETGATKALNVGVKLDDLNLSLLSGEVKLSGLTVNNPAGYELPYLMNLNEGFVKVKTGSLLSDTVVVDTIKFTGLNVSIEQKGLESNLMTVMKSLPKKEADKPVPADEEEEVEEAAKKKLVINTLEISDINVSMKLLPVPGQTDVVKIKLPPIKMTDLGKEKDVDIAKLVQLITVKVTEQLAKQGGNIVPEEVLTQIKGFAEIDPQQFLDGGLGFLEEGAKGGQKLKETIEESGEKLKETLGGLGDLFKDKKKDKE